ncbi:hypothetical protein [Tardiphaga robiniae]|nr:hypothetical protein [Tardiphaga robiniae]
MRLYTRIDISPTGIPPKSSRNASAHIVAALDKKQHIARGTAVD